MSKTKKIRVTDSTGWPLVGAYVYYEDDVTATNVDGYATITVDDPYSLVKITHVNGQDVELPFVELPKFIVLKTNTLDPVIIDGSEKKKGGKVWWAVAGIAAAFLIFSGQEKVKKVIL